MQIPQQHTEVDPPAAPSRGPRRPPARRWLIGQRWLQRAVQSLLVISLGYLLITIFVMLQGEREAIRPAGAVVVIQPSELTEDATQRLRARLDRALDLYKQGLVRQVIVTEVGPSQTQVVADQSQAYLIQRGLPESAVRVDYQDEQLFVALQRVVAEARLQGISSMLVVSDPAQQLRSLKMLRDLGIFAYAAPARDQREPASRAGIIMVEAWLYLRYVMTGW